jgi:integrase
MALLGAMQGLRAHEIAKIKGEHLDLIDRTMIVAGKGGVTSTLPLHHLVVEIAYQMPCARATGSRAPTVATNAANRSAAP